MFDQGRTGGEGKYREENIADKENLLRTEGWMGRRLYSRVGPQVEKSSNLHITADSTGSIHKIARGKKFDPKKVRLGCGDLI